MADSWSFAFDAVFDKLLAEGVRVLMFRDEARFLYSMAKGVAYGNEEPLIVELGTHEGASAIIMASAMRQVGVDGGARARLVSVDDYSQVAPARALRNVSDFQVSELVELVESDGVSAAGMFEENSIDMIYHDDGHAYDQVSGSLRAYWPKVKLCEGRVTGLICGHDYNPWSTDGIGVVLAVDDWKKQYACALSGLAVTETVWWTIKH